MAKQYDNDIDDYVDDELFNYLNLDTPKSFFLFAGAGSGKTRSLVTALSRVRETKGLNLRQRRQKIATITYTNAACDEIKYRLDNDPLFFVATIHSFIWDLIKKYPHDLKDWIQENLQVEITKLEQAAAKGRPNTKAATDRIKKIESKTRRLKNLRFVNKFTYNPNGNNITRDSLNHSEVIKIGAYFLENKPLLRQILIQKYPILLIDESQDTKKELIDAFILVQKENKNSFSLGLFGDTMQRIYSDGKVDIAQNLPLDWEKPIKKMNHRCPKRVIKLLNKIRSQVDSQIQLPRTEKEEGFVRLFLIPSSGIDKQKIEDEIAQRMSIITGDNRWFGKNKNVKTLTLEHHMAATRMGFYDFFAPLYKLDSTTSIDGSMSGVRFFTQFILPLYQANQKGNEYEISRIVKKHSNLLSADSLKKFNNQFEAIEQVQTAVDSLFSLWNKNIHPKLIDILINVSESNLFPIPDSFKIIIYRIKAEEDNIETLSKNEFAFNDKLIDAWDDALEAPFNELIAYHDYTSGAAKFDTHQGVKGLEFERVSVILDDNEARGFLFKYDKLFGATELSKNDKKNITEGKETGIDRTRRLFYVICSRAKKSLAIIAYSPDPQLVKNYVIAENWFEESEIEILD